MGSDSAVGLGVLDYTALLRHITARAADLPGPMPRDPAGERT
ncbi:hypothetical protein [Nonomuraea ceibae]|nr:hypothetical protein [Nonomuraea ceibae]